MGLNIIVYKIVEFNEKIIKDIDISNVNKINGYTYRLFNLDDFFIDNTSAREFQFIWHESKLDLSVLPIGSRLIEVEWRDDDDEHVFIYQDIDGKIKRNENVKIIETFSHHILTKEIGYQSKGANRDFYKENMWSSNPIYTKELLDIHHRRYFSGQEGDVEVRKQLKNTTEFLNYTNEELKNNFQKNIVNKFIEGETFVLYC